MNKIVLGLASMAGAYGIHKLKQHITDTNPELAKQLQQKMYHFEKTLDVYKDVDLQKPFTLIKPLVEMPKPKGEVYTSNQVLYSMVSKQYNCKLLNNDPNSIFHRLTRRNFDEIFRDKIGKDWVPDRLEYGSDNVYILQGQGDMSDVFWLLEKYLIHETTDYPDGIFWYVDSVFVKNNNLRWVKRETIQKIIYPPDGCVYDLTPDFVIDAELSMLRGWTTHLIKHSPVDFIGDEFHIQKARFTNYKNRCKPYNAMFYGKPGCGKTTMMRSWFYEEKVNVLQLSAECLYETRSLRYKLFALAPDVIVIEDLDRLEPEKINLLLNFFEHDVENKMPYDESPEDFKTMIFSSCNHPERISDAIWRPGRMDQLIHIAVPTSDQWPNLVRNMCSKLDMPYSQEFYDKHVQMIDHILTGHTISHLEQYMLRVKEFGPDYKVPFFDKTFTPPIKWNGD